MSVFRAPALRLLRVRCASSAAVPPPTPLQMRRLFVTSAVPFVAFGIVDQSVLLYAGDAIEPLIQDILRVFYGLASG